VHPANTGAISTLAAIAESGEAVAQAAAESAANAEVLHLAAAVTHADDIQVPFGALRGLDVVSVGAVCKGLRGHGTVVRIRPVRAGLPSRCAHHQPRGSQ
jgi:hypothetical protein